MNKLAIFAFGTVCLAGLTSSARANVYNYTDWTATDNSGVTGSIVVNGNTIGVTYTGEYNFAQTNGGTDYWSPNAAYLSTQVSNAPGSTDMVSITGGNGVLHTITFSQAITNPILDIISLGQNAVPVSYAFDAPINLLSNGGGYWGPGSIVQTGANSITGYEGNGTVEIVGSVTSFSWVTDAPEYWHGFTVGAEANPVPEPTTMAVLGLGAAAMLRRRKK